MKSLNNLLSGLKLFSIVFLSADVNGWEFSSLKECATLDRVNDRCPDPLESCGYYLVKKAEKSTERD